MRTYDEDDARKEIEQDHAEPWMVECIKKNPDYNCWGNSEDYMWKKGKGWDSQQEIHSVSELWELNDFNELVNFHFQTHRKGHECPDCEGIGYNPKTMELYESWYGRIYGKPSWMYQLTEVEVLALAKAGRLSQCGVKAYYDDEKKAWFSWGKEKKRSPPRRFHPPRQ